MRRLSSLRTKRKSLSRSVSSVKLRKRLARRKKRDSASSRLNCKKRRKHVRQRNCA